MTLQGVMQPKRGAILAAGIPVAIVLAFFVASVVAWIYLGLPSSKFDPFKMPAFFWYYRHDPVVLKAFSAGMVVGLVLTGIMLWWLLKRKPPLHGAARFAKEREIRRAGFRAATHVSSKTLADRYFAGRPDGLRPSTGRSNFA